jgi:hypothetical protein
LQQLPEGPGKKVAFTGVIKNSAATLANRSAFIGRHPSTLLPECKCVQSVAGAFDKQGSNFRYELAGTYILRYASSWHDIYISPNLIRTRIGWHQHSSHAYGQDRGYPSVHLPMRWSVQQGR